MEASDSPGLAAALRWAGAAALALWLGLARQAIDPGPLTAGGALWLLAALGCLEGSYFLALRAARRAWPAQPGEPGRWLLVGIATVFLTLPFYTRDSFGAGDAYWYSLMLSDFVEQIRHGTFPVWIGQSRYAFNGAVVPLRVAPWLQHLTGLVDGLTARRLAPTPLKNLVLCVNALAVAASAYLCLRRVLPARPGMAAFLALAWLASPGFLAPSFVLDQYMMFSAMPFLPPLLLGCCELWSRPAAWGPRVLIAVSLAGLWLAHTPMALWGMLLAGGMYLGVMAARRPLRGEPARLLGMAALFLVLGAWPIGSAFSIDQPVHLTATGAEVPDQIRHDFPGDFLPLDEKHLGPGACQLGYTLVAIGLAALILLRWRRPRGSGAFALAMLVIVPLTLPVPGLTAWLWRAAPNWFVGVQNVWPMQRLFALWGLVIVFSFALALGAADIRLRRRGRAWMLGALAVAAGWSLWEAEQLRYVLRSSMADAGSAEVMLRPENLILTRYPYAAFANPPGYASHGYMDPLLENRLLDPRTGEIVAANADAAAPPAGAAGRLVQSGTWTAVSTVHNRIYTLEPGIRLEPARRYALRIEGIPADRSGVLQILHDGLFREYLLPDSGVAIHNNTSYPRAFGSFPTSEKVVPLLFHGPAPIEPVLQFVQPKYDSDRYVFARFRLYTYGMNDLPVRVTSWIPYKAEVYAPHPALLETPRVWQRGWHAQVDGREAPAAASPEHLVAVPVPAGHSHVVLVFRPSWWLEGWYWLALLGWVGVALGAAGRLVRAGLAPPPPA
ncbi:MAG TPA: hypothetical protein VHC86_08885 [Opitutaceae bacterium]|nr:hypothetical protein [Opitutaceae bacterium]